MAHADTHPGARHTARLGEASQTQSIDTRTRSTQSLGRADAHTQVHAVIPKVPRGKPQSPGLPPPPRPPARSSHPLLLPLTTNATGQTRPDPAGQQSQRDGPGSLSSAGPACARVPGSRVLRPAARSGELSFAATPRLGPCAGGSRLACGAVPGLPVSARGITELPAAEGVRGSRPGRRLALPGSRPLSLLARSGCPGARTCSLRAGLHRVGHWGAPRKKGQGRVGAGIMERRRSSSARGGRGRPES